MAKHCNVCGNEVEAEAKFCNYCGVAVDSIPEVKSKNQPLSDRKSQARFLSMLSIALIILVLGFYIIRDSAPRNEVTTLDGEWVGTAYSNDGRVLEYTLRLEQSGSEVTGWAMSEDQTGGADANVSGTFRDSQLSVRERGGSEMGDWAGQEMCYWELNLELSHSYGEESLVGSYEGIECDSAGTMTLSRAE